MATAQLELILAQIKPLPFADKLRLLQLVAQELQPTTPASELKAEGTGLVYGKYRDTGRRGLVYGEFADAPGRMSTEEDFKLAEWHPTEEQLNGEY